MSLAAGVHRMTRAVLMNWTKKWRGTAMNSALYSCARPPAERTRRASKPPGRRAEERQCRCAVFDPLIPPAWRVARQSAGEYHAYGDYGRLYVGLLPDACKADEYWHVAAYSSPGLPPAWHMDFDSSTPLDLVRAITATLAADVSTVVEPRPYLHGRHLDDMGAVWQPLIDAGWTIACDETCYLATSPDDVITLTYAPSRKGLHALLHPDAWLVEAVPDPDADPVWCAMFHDGTPWHLVAAFTSALVDVASQRPGNHGLPRSRGARVQ
jgi:hypothetical protein